MSAFFVTYSINKIAREFNGLGVLTIVQIYLNRFIRFIPLYYVVLIVSWVMLFAYDMGPLWIAMGQLFHDCDRDIWANLLLVNNFTTSGLSSCMIWSTYIANEI
jgi:peptidoglycan/LPS O-acetylase OafA/YrhL